MADKDANSGNKRWATRIAAAQKNPLAGKIVKRFNASSMAMRMVIGVQATILVATAV